MGEIQILKIVESHGLVEILLDIPKGDFYSIPKWNFVSSSIDEVRVFLIQKWACLKNVRMEITWT